MMNLTQRQATLTKKTLDTTLAEHLWQSDNILRRNIALCLLGSLLMVAAAHIKVPIGAVPISMQSLVVLLIGASYGMRLAGITMLAYLTYGIMGAPVFAGGIGPLTLLGPTGGYLIGFYFAAMLAGFLAQRGFTKSFAKMILLGMLASVVIYLCGLLQLGIVIGWDKPILQLGLLPFIAGDSLKIILAAALISFAWNKQTR